MSEPFLFRVFNEVRRDERLADPGLDAYFLALDLFRKDRKQADQSFSRIVFLLATMWLKSRDNNQVFFDIMERRRQTLSEFAEFIRNEPVEEALKPAGPKNAPREPDSADEKIKQPKTSRAPSNPPPPAGEDKARDPDTREKQWFGDTAFTIEQSPVSPGNVVSESPAAPVVARSESPFILSNEFFPVKSRQLQQAWRALKSRGKGPDSAQISFKMTVSLSARQGIFTDFTYEKEKVNRLHLFMLIDRSERMAAVEDFGLELARTVSINKDHLEVRPWFFNRLPRYLGDTDDYLIHSADLRTTCSLRKLFGDVPPKNRAVLIYSDAGVFGYDWSKQRNDATQKMIRWLLPRTGTLTWLNPSPKERWEDRAYAGLRALVPMFSTEPADFSQAIDALRGKVNLKFDPHVA